MESESSHAKTTELELYEAHLSPLQLKAYLIAKDHLKTSFDLVRSNGYAEWKKTDKPPHAP